MSDFTPKLGLWQLISLQGDAYALYNESLFRTELFAAGIVKSRVSGIPPSTIVDGDAYIVPSGASGIWASRTDRIQLGLNNAWLDIAPARGVAFWVDDEDVSIRYLGSGWFEYSGSVGGGSPPPGVAYLNQANIFAKTQTVTPVSLTDAAIVAVDAALSNTFTVILEGNRTLSNPSNLKNGAIYNFYVAQDATGSRSLSYGSAYKFGADGTPTLSTAANTIDWLSFQCIGSDLRFAGIKKGF